MSKVSENVPGYGCIIIILVFIFGGVSYKCSKSEHQKDSAPPKIEKKEPEKKPIMKPLTKEQEDSIRIENEKWEEEYDKKTVVIVMKGDSTYHYCTWCVGVELSKARLMSEYHAKKKGKKLCEFCSLDYYNKSSIENGEFDNIESDYDIHQFIREYDD